MSAVLPSFLHLNNSGSEPSGYALAVNDPYLRVGRILRVYVPTDGANHSKKFIEYDVEVDLWEGSDSYTQIVYPRARMASMFGGIADFSHHTPRIVTPEPDKITQGSLVLVLCANGDTRQALIIGGIQHPGLPVETPDKDGHNLAFEFNGVNLTINKDGELTVKFRGATKADGTLSDDADPKAEGSNLHLAKDGSIQLQTPDDHQHLLLDHSNGKAHIQADNEARLKAQSVVIEASTTKIGGDDASEALMKGTTYRAAQSTLHQVLTQQLQLFAQGLLASGLPPLVPLAAMVGGMVAAIEAFEAQATSYLSTKNTTD